MSGFLSDGKETYRVETYGKIIALTRQAIINDDLNAFDRINVMQGQAAAQTVNNLFVAVFTANGGDGADLADGNCNEDDADTNDEDGR